MFAYILVGVAGLAAMAFGVTGLLASIVDEGPEFEEQHTNPDGSRKLFAPERHPAAAERPPEKLVAE